VSLGVHDLWLFVISGLALNVTPGPDTLYVIGRSTTQGFRGGALAALGIGTGVLVHVAAAALGLSAILAASATAFTVVKLVGASDRLYVGVSLIRSAGRPAARVAAPAPIASDRSIFLQGFWTNVLNPKVALFFLAFLPQFVAPDAPSKPLAFLLLGALFDLNGTTWSIAVAWFSAHLSRRYGLGGVFKTWFNRCVGAMFIAVGLRLAVTYDR
jgi:threonine/homoserine/homoserine lactone efflux protein